MKVNRLFLIGIPVCIGIQWVVFQLTSDWSIRCVASILLFGGLSVVGERLEREADE